MKHDEDKTPPPAAASAASDKRTIETWGQAKGLWPQFAKPGSRGNPEYWKYAAAKAFMKWQDGQEVSEAEFDEALTKASSQVTR